MRVVSTVGTNSLTLPGVYTNGGTRVSQCTIVPLFSSTK